MIRTSFCTIAFQKNKWGKEKAFERPLQQLLPLVADAGYNAVEIWVDHLLLLDDAQRQSIREQLATLNLAVSQISPYFNFTTSNESAADSMRTALALLHEARRVKARAIRVFTGKTASKDATDEQWTRCVTCLRELCDASASDGILWNLEHHSWNLTDTTDGILKLIERVARPNLKVLLHGNMLSGDYAPLAPHLSHVHASNSREKQGTLLADGEVNWTAILQRLRASNFDGYVSIEWFGDNAERVLREEAKYLKKILA